MLRLFRDAPTVPSRAQQIWQILVGKAMQRQSMTYGQLADLLGWKGAGTSAQFLAPIAFYCIDAGLPPLTVLVVNQETGLPGEGIPEDLEALNKLREEVYAYDWYGLVPPTAEELKAFA